jgi:glycosyltransferase involved in cell wall biosynthesis
MKPLTSKNPLVSVIIPNYNHAKYLDERIQSVLNQTYQNFEVIILDDLSTDNSKEVIEKYRNAPHVSQIVYNEKNTGLPFKQWDKGISLAKGELIWLAESDDSCDRRLLEVLVKDLIDTDSVYAFCNLIYMDSHSYLRNTPMNIGDNGVTWWPGKSFIFQYLRFNNSVANASGCIFRKDAALQVDHQYEKYRGSGDWLFWIEMAELGNVVFDKRTLNYFRQHGDNTTATLINNGTNMIDNYDILVYLKKRNLITNKDVIRAKIRQFYVAKRSTFTKPQIKEKVLETWGYNWKYKLLLPIYTAYINFKRKVGSPL